MTFGWYRLERPMSITSNTSINSAALTQELSATVPVDPQSPLVPRSGSVVSRPQRSRHSRAIAWLAMMGCVGAVAVGLTPVSAQETIEDARQRQEELEREELLARTELHIVNAELADVQGAYDAAAELVRLQETKVAAAQLELDAAELRQRQIEVAIGWAEYDLGELSDVILETAIEAYLGDVQGQGTTLLQSNDLQEGATRVAMLDLASAESEDVLDLVRGIRERQEALEEEQVELVARIKLIESELSEELTALEANREIREELRAEVAERVRGWQGQIAEIEEEDAELESFIANKQALAAGQQPKAADVSTEGYVWPTAGGVGSGFGNRLHPVLGYYRMHTGLDIGGAHGAPIYAANSGEIIVAGVQGGYGNTIVVDHGDGLSSLYAHQTRFAVNVGETVARGDVIGYVGSTGMSTGPHLHFEMRLYGTPIDPMPFMP